MKLGEHSRAVEALQTHELDIQNTTALTACWLSPLPFADRKLLFLPVRLTLPAEHSVFLSIRLVLTPSSSLRMCFPSPHEKSQPHHLGSIFSAQSSLDCSNYLILTTDYPYGGILVQ